MWTYLAMEVVRELLNTLLPDHWQIKEID